jgi:DNA polymerase-1
MFGRRRPTPDLGAPNRIVRAAAERAAGNMPIQGTEADLMKKAMLAVDKQLPPNANLILQVHDSLIIECEENLATDIANLLKKTMEEVAPELPVKLAVDVTTGHDWGKL